ncbi:MAG: GspE/PulE family protein [bacterium]|nr:GspE/PulE family protein [bacterium]
MSVLSATTQKQVEEHLVKAGLITSEKIAELHIKAENEFIPLFSLFISEGGVNGEDITKTIAKVTKVPYVNLSNAPIEQETLELLPQDIAERYMAVPLGEMQHRLVVAMLDADNVQAVDFLSNKIGRPLKVYAASEEGIRSVLARYKANIGSGMDNAFGDQEDIENLVVDHAKDKEIGTIAQDSPVSKILTSILDYAATHRASDIHMEPTEHDFKIRCRIDGILREVMKLPKASEPPIVSRIKILSNLKIDEHRIPQDGQFTVRVANKAIDLRIAIAPVVWGEQVVIRLLDKSGTSFKLEDMGYRGRALRSIRNGIKNPNGMILTSGPTGSGKSTSLYALIQEIKDESINIVTLEDPVEYKMSGINQIQINNDVGLTFASGLRSILRQDPNVVMVGEIRDAETATLAVQAALTGHLVLSTLHTNSAAGILPRLLDMGIEPFLIASTVRTVIGQRLVRKLHEPEPYQSDTSETEVIKKQIGQLLPKKDPEVKAAMEDLGYETLPLADQKAYTLYKGKESADSPNGYKGRVGLYEVFEVTESIQELIMKRASSAEIQKAAQAEGMITMQQDGYLKALAGSTSLQEISRVASEDTA